MVLRANEPRRSATSLCAGPKIRRKSLARNLPSLLAANAVMVFTNILLAARCYHSAKKPGTPKAQVLGSRSCRLEVEMSFNKARHRKPSDGMEYCDEEVFAGDGWLARSRDGGSRVGRDRKSTRLNSSHVEISYAVFCLKK